jgi:hypothetical protein
VRTAFALVAVVGCGSASNPSNAGPPAVAADEVATPTETAPAAAVSFPATCRAIASDLETLTRQFPQLANYRAVDQEDCHVSYKHKTHRSTARGGWSAGVPHPDDDGIFLYIGIWDPNGSDMRQIDTQPFTGDRWIGDRRVTYLILEGKKVTSADAAITKILERHGMTMRQ